MKKVITTIWLLAICTISYAQDKGKTYLNLNYSSASLSQPATSSISNKFGAGFTIGHTYYLHKEPVANLFWFGIDATWFDLNYNNFSYDYKSYNNDTEKESIHQGEIGVHIGPSVSINPVDKLNVKAYFRYAPSCAVLYDTKAEDPSFNYVSMFVGGLSINYGIIGIGFEARFGSTKLQEYQFVRESGKKAEEKKVDTDISGFRAYLSFRF